MKKADRIALRRARTKKNRDRRTVRRVYCRLTGQLTKTFPYFGGNWRLSDVSP